jgi:hypothetical protein
LDKVFPYGKIKNTFMISLSFEVYSYCDKNIVIISNYLLLFDK